MCLLDVLGSQGVVVKCSGEKKENAGSGSLTLGIFQNWDNFFCTEFSRKIKK